MKWFFNLINFYTTALDSEIWTDLEWSFSVVSKSVEGYTLEDGEYRFSVVVNLANSAFREIFRIWKVSGNVLYYDKRISPNWIHIQSEWTSVQINNVAEFFNEMSANVDVFWYAEQTSQLGVRVFWGVAKYNWIITSVDTTIINAIDNWTHYIWFNYDTDSFEAVNQLDYDTFNWFIVCETVAAGWDVLSVTDKRAMILDSRGNDWEAGKSLLNWAFDPTTQWNDWDFYINTTTNYIFGPKTWGNWWDGVSIKWEQWIPGSAYEAPATGQEQELEDNNIPQDLSAVNTTVWVQIEIVYNDWSKTVYTATTIKYYDIDWDLYAQETWLNGSWNWSNILYTWSHISEVNWITWVVTFSGHVAYTNMVNTFQEWNIFQKASIFNWPAVFWLNWPWAWNYEIDFSTSSKQYVALPNAQTISWVNIVNGVTLLVAVDNTSWGSLPLTLGTFMNIDWVKEYDKYQIGDMPTTLDAWIHMFVMEVFSTGIHICYSWQSTAII